MTGECRGGARRAAAAESGARKMAFPLTEKERSLRHRRSAATWENSVEHSGSLRFADTEEVTGSNPVAPINEPLTSTLADRRRPSRWPAGRTGVAERFPTPAGCRNAECPDAGYRVPPPLPPGWVNLAGHCCSEGVGPHCLRGEEQV